MLLVRVMFLCGCFALLRLDAWGCRLCVFACGCGVNVFECAFVTSGVVV